METKNLKMVEIDHKKFAVEVLGDNAKINLTQMAKSFGRSKKPDNWLRLDETKEYLGVLSVSQKRDTADLLKVKRGGKNQGTWCTDYRIAMRFAQWLSPEFSIMVDEMLVKLLRGNMALLEPFNGIYPVLCQGKPFYNYLDVLQSLGYSCLSGAVQARKRNFPQHFVLLYGRNFVTPDFCRFLEARRNAYQLTIDFAEKCQHAQIANL